MSSFGVEEPLIPLNGPKPSRKSFMFKFLVIFMLVILIKLVNYINNLTSQSPECISDTAFNVSSSLNSYFSIHETQKNALIILSSFFLDVNILLLLWNYLLWGTSWRPAVLFTTFYALRITLQALTVLGFPQGFIWGYPGVYSFFITYVRSSDFFYSGHVGMMLFTGFYFHSLQESKLVYYSIFCCAFEGLVMVIVRCHYFIDILAALIYCHYFWIHSKSISVFFDCITASLLDRYS